MLLQSDITLANPSLALAIVTGFLALGTIGMAIAALWQARSTAASVGLQRKELAAVQAQAKVTADQLKQARHEFFTGRQRALARLHVDGSFDDQGQLSGHVTYVSGTDPAFSVRVWTRHNRITHGLPCGTLTPTRNDYLFVFPAVGPDMSDSWPFPETRDLPAHQLHCFYVGLTWRDVDDSLQRWLVQKSRDGPPTVILDDVALDLDNIGLS